jgi:hypothetical protein
MSEESEIHSLARAKKCRIDSEIGGQFNYFGIGG